MPESAPPKRPRELEDALNYWLYHPLAWQLARLLARTPITPNMVSVLGGCFVIAAGIAYLQPGWPLPALAGMALHMLWHVVDGADGDLARITGRASPIGEMVDGICDYASHFVLYLILAWILAHQAHPLALGLWAWPLAVLAGASHIAQANHVEVQRRAYQFWVYDKPWLGQTHGTSDAATRKPGLAGLAAAYLGVAGSVAPNVARIDPLARSADPARREALRTAARAETGPLFPLQQLLGPNPRAIVLGLSMLAGSPLWYFLWQIVVLNGLLALSIRRHNRAAEAIAARVG